MLKFVSLALVFSLPAFALDLQNLKEKSRSYFQQALGEEMTAKVFGPPKREGPKIEMPPIPNIKSDATSVEVYRNKKGGVYLQGKEFQQLSMEEKRKYRLAFIEEAYLSTRNSPPKEADLAKFLNVLEQGGSREGVYRAITLDPVYASLESFEETPSKALIDFATNFASKYLGKNYDRKAMKQLNLWSIKRILVEKSLETMDALAKKPNDLRSWYALLSSELAKDFPQLWKNKARTQESALFHYEWASKAPFQHIKSEVIIKLHKAMNTLHQE